MVRVVCDLAHSQAKQVITARGQHAERELAWRSYDHPWHADCVYVGETDYMHVQTYIRPIWGGVMLSNILRALLFLWSGLPVDPMLRRKTAEMGEYRSLIGTDLCSWQSRSTVNVAFFFLNPFFLVLFGRKRGGGFWNGGSTFIYSLGNSRWARSFTWGSMSQA